MFRLNLFLRNMFGRKRESNYITSFYSYNYWYITRTFDSLFQLRNSMTSWDKKINNIQKRSSHLCCYKDTIQRLMRPFDTESIPAWIRVIQLDYCSQDLRCFRILDRKLSSHLSFYSSKIDWWLLWLILWKSMSSRYNVYLKAFHKMLCGLLYFCISYNLST